MGAYSGYGIAFDGAGSWNFGNNLTRNVVIFGVDKSSSSYTDKCKNNLLVLGGGPSHCFNGSFGSPEEKFRIKLSKARTKVCLNLHSNGDNSYFFVNEKEIIYFKVDKKSINFQAHFCLGSIPNGFGPAESREVS